MASKEDAAFVAYFNLQIMAITCSALGKGGGPKINMVENKNTYPRENLGILTFVFIFSRDGNLKCSHIGKLMKIPTFWFISALIRYPELSVP